MIWGTEHDTPLTKAYFIILLGQSNADGRREPTRLQNTQFNYKGIAAGYPTPRVAQEQYVADPADVYIYHKSVASSADMSVDVATWQAYEAGVNSSHDDNSFGTELSCATLIQEATDRPVYIVKVAYGGTSLNTNTPSASQFSPGNWNPTNRYIAMEYYLKRAMRDFRAANPTIRPELLCINWWQGENDGINGVSTATYEAQFLLLKAYIDKAVRGEFVIEEGRDPIWNLTRLNFNENAAEALINTALDNVATALDDTYIINCAAYPKGDELTVAEAAPLAVGLPNADGGLDNDHTSYIGQLAVGELQFENIQSAGLI